MTVTLTDKFIRGLSSRERTNYFDADTRGLVLRVGTIRKTWYFRYGSPAKWLRLGEYGPEPQIPLVEARKRARQSRVMIDEGKDPVSEQIIEEARIEHETARALAAAAPVLTFRDFVPVFLDFQKGRIQEWKSDENKIRRWLIKPWGDLPLKDITRRHCNEILLTAQKLGLGVGGNRIAALMSRIFTVAMDQELIDHHPAARLLKRAKEVVGERVLTDDEIRALWKDLTANGTAASDVIKLRLLLGQRGGETLGILRSEVNLADAFWEMPRRRTKTRKNIHAVALPPLALAVLQARLAALPEDETRVFPFSRNYDEYRDLSVMTGGTYVWKDLRRTVATRLAELGFTTEVIDRVLNHARAGVTDKNYNKYQYLPEIRTALEAWDRAVARILDGKPMQDEKVVPITRRRS